MKSVASTRSIPSRSSARAANAASSSHGRNFSPQALKPKSTPARPPAPSTTTIGPESRDHESSSPTSKSSTASEHAARATAACSGRTAISTGSKAAIAFATSACDASAAGSSEPHMSARAGQHISVRSCGVHSGGIENGGAIAAGHYKEGAGATGAGARADSASASGARPSSHAGAGRAARGRIRRHREQRLDDGGIELRPRVVAQLLHRDLERQRAPVGAIGRHRVEGVARRDDPGGERDRVAGEAVRVAAPVPALVRRAHDDADVAQQAADLVEHPLALDRVRAHQRPLRVVQRPRLVDDRVGDDDLADVVQQRAQLGRLAHVLVDAEPLRDLHREPDDVLGVAPGVLVVLLEHVAQQQRRAAVGAPELERLGDAGLALAGEDRDQRDGREREQRGGRHPARGDRREQPERGEQRIDAEDDAELGERVARAHPEAQPEARDGHGRLDGELGGERERVHRPQRPVGLLRPERDQHDRRRQRPGRVRERERHAREGAAPAQRIDERGEQEGQGAEQRDERRRQQQQHGHEHRLRGDRVAGAGGELHAREHRERDGEGQRERQVELARGRRARRQHDRAEQHQRGEQRAPERLAHPRPAQRAGEPVGKPALGRCIDSTHVPWSRHTGMPT